MSANVYADITNEEFDAGLRELMKTKCGTTDSWIETVLAIPGIYEILAEEWNNEVLDLLRPSAEDNDESDTN
jgi:hypothetical protein